MAKMKAEAGSEEANLFIHKQEESEDDDVWDDAQLVKAYDRAIYKAKQQILDKLQSEMSLTEADVQDVLGDPPTPKKRKKRKVKSKAGSNYSMWKVGSACRAIWSEDGEEYECEIIEMIDGNWCIVRFIGYNNVEEVLLRELTPSFGKNVIELQIATAKCYNAALKEQALDTEEQDSAQQNPLEDGEVMSSTESCGPSKPKLNSVPPRRRPMVFPHQSPPPAPPMPPGAFSRVPDPMAGGSIPLPRTGDDVLNAMLQSWYVCGYYTGYYQRDSKDHPK